MNRTVIWLGRIAVIGLISIGGGATPLRADQNTDAIVASGELDGWLLAGSLFHIDEFWMRVASGTEFHRWLSQGFGRSVVVRLTADDRQGGDDAHMRILSGVLIHQTAPKPTPVTVNVVGRLPEGDSGFVHVFYVSDDIAGTNTLGAVTFETADVATVSKFSPFDGRRVTIIIEIR